MLEEDKIAANRIQQVRSKTKLKAIEERMPELTRNARATMSVYGRKEVAHDIVERPFTSVLQNDEIKFNRNNELREIDEVKKRLNKYHVTIRLTEDKRAAAQDTDGAVDSGRRRGPRGGEGGAAGCGLPAHPQPRKGEETEEEAQRQGNVQGQEKEVRGLQHSG
jgi:hypothetical protein